MAKNDKKLCDIEPVKLYPIELLDLAAEWHIRKSKNVCTHLWVGAINRMIRESMDINGNICLHPADIPKKFAYCFSTWLIEDGLVADLLHYRMDCIEICHYSEEIAKAVASDANNTLEVLCLAVRSDLELSAVTNRVFKHFKSLHTNTVTYKAPKRAEISDVVMTVWEACTLATEMKERQRSQV